MIPTTDAFQANGGMTYKPQPLKEPYSRRVERETARRLAEAADILHETKLCPSVTKKGMPCGAPFQVNDPDGLCIGHRRQADADARKAAVSDGLVTP